jgi:hypothetical protein
MDTMTAETLITHLQDESAYDHPVDNISLRETHISWVLLTGNYAYKIKKPVDFGFLDFSTLEKRKHYCEEEVRLNRRLAPNLYLGVVPICIDNTHPHISGAGKIIEYAVKMRQFDTTQEFDVLLARDKLTSEHIDETARVIADFHASIAIADAHSSFGTPKAVLQPVYENFEQIKLLGNEWLEKHQLINTLKSLHQWANECAKRLEPFISSRKEKGFIRECHGDLHLRNIVLSDNQVTPFDGIEFNDNLRWVDVISELAFLLMDIDDHERPDLSRLLLNQYLQLTGDYDGLTILRFYQMYRAMVRAKVAGLQQLQSSDEVSDLSQEIENYLQLALTYTRTPPPKLIITFGLSGSGKTYLSHELLERSDIIRIRSDVERKRLFGMDETARDKSGIHKGIYTNESSQQTYHHLLGLADTILKAGFSVIVDAAFLKKDQRQAFNEYVREKGIPFLILHCVSEIDTQRKRLVKRQQGDQDASDADSVILDQQIAHHDPLTESEKKDTMTVDTSEEPDIKQVVDWLNTDLTQ